MRSDREAAFTSLPCWVEDSLSNAEEGETRADREEWCRRRKDHEQPQMGNWEGVRVGSRHGEKNENDPWKVLTWAGGMVKQLCEFISWFSSYFPSVHPFRRHHCADTIEALWSSLFVLLIYVFVPWLHVKNIIRNKYVFLSPYISFIMLQ